MLEQFIRAFARLRLNSAHAGRHSGFSDQLKEPNLPCLSAMGAAAQFLAECVDLNHPYLVAVLVAEKGQRALLNRFSNPHDLRSDRVIEPYSFVDESLDFLKLYRAHRREMSEVEPQTARRDQ